MQIVFNYVWKAITKYANKLITNIAIQATRKMYFPVSGIILYKKVNKEQTICLTNKRREKYVLQHFAFKVILVVAFSKIDIYSCQKFISYTLLFVKEIVNFN